MTELQGVVARGVVLLVILGFAVHGELRTGHIKNPITLGGLVVALLVAAFTGHFLDGLGGVVIVAVPFLFAFSRFWLTGGTTKLAIALAACVGVVGAPVILVGGALWFGLLYRSQLQAPRTSHPSKASSPVLAVLSVLGFALGAAKLLVH